MTLSKMTDNDSAEGRAVSPRARRRRAKKAGRKQRMQTAPDSGGPLPSGAPVTLEIENTGRVDVEREVVPDAFRTGRDIERE